MIVCDKYWQISQGSMPIIVHVICVGSGGDMGLGGSVNIFFNSFFQEEYSKQEAVMWFDASLRITCSELSQMLEPMLKEKGFTFVKKTGHSITSATNPKMYIHLPANASANENISMAATGCLIFVNKTDIYKNFIRPWSKCALNRNCISPSGSKERCDVKKYSPKSYANCHRFDQSALSLLILMKANKSVDDFFTQKACIVFRRKPTTMFHLKLC